MEEMSNQEYLVMFLSLIIGLGLAELLRNLRELIQPRRAVHWHPLPLIWVVMILLVLAQFWWGYYEVTMNPLWQNYFAFLVLLSSAISLYLICAFALPSEEAGDTIDLEKFYYSFPRRLWFFGMVIVVIVTAQGIGWMGRLGVRWGLGEWFRLTIGLLSVGMIITKRKSYHWGVTLCFVVGFLFYVTQSTLQLVR